MFVSRVKKTYSLLFHFIAFIVLVSFLLRFSFLMISIQKSDLSLLAFLRIFGIGFFFDIGVAIFFSVPYALYLLILPAKWNHITINRIITYIFFAVAVLILLFSFFAEFAFWEEFESRFNFIAVDYLVYTYEVIGNINQSYPLPSLIGGMILFTGMTVWLFRRRNYFNATFGGTAKFMDRLLVSGIIVGLALVYGLFVNNTLAEKSSNRYQNELAKAGVYSFFAAFRNNELNYDHFYQLMDPWEAFTIMRKELADSSSRFTDGDLTIRRQVTSPGTMIKPNVIMVTIESLSADFMAHFGDTSHLMPFLDSLASENILFTDMYATGTRTVRGMEALSLAVPPTPGSSIVRRGDNDNLSTVGHIFREAGYQTGFFYGGDGYFDNMNQYFGSNGYDITDRGRNMIAKDHFAAARYHIPDSLVHFENAWGICDEDLYDAVIRDADRKFGSGQLFYDFVMTTSNHRPYTYPTRVVDIPPGTGREGAVKYTDYAISRFMEKIKTKPWFANTIIIFVADHCASSAGKNDIDIAKYHIPAIICNLPRTGPMQIQKQCSQIDLYPTLFNLLNWSYQSNLYGQNVLSLTYHPRIMAGTYQKLGYLENDTLVILGPQQKAESFLYHPASNELTATKSNQRLTKKAIANYQTAYYLFKHRGLNGSK